MLNESSESRLHVFRRYWVFLLLLVVVAMVVLSRVSSSSTEERRISVYSGTANYSLPVLERSGGEYVGLLEILEPLGSVSAKSQGRRWKLRFRNLEAEFTAEKTRARVHGKQLDLSYPFLVENGRGLVPIASLPVLLSRFIGTPVLFHEGARRLFIGNVATQFSATLMKTLPPRLVLSFSAPVNPSIATEPSGVRMLFTREPLVETGIQTLTFNDHTIPSATYRESNGAAEITVAGNQPLMAVFSNDGRTITIAPAPQASSVSAGSSSAAGSGPAASAPQAPPAIPVAPPGSAQGTPAATQTPAAPAAAPVTPLFLVVVDASHGGDDRGAALTAELPEKDVTLAIARRVRQELQNRGIAVLMLRDADLSLPLDQRAAMANMARASVYICIHASSEGNGVRLYTAAIPSMGETRGIFGNWDSAQASSLPLSQILLGSVATELQKKITVRNLSAPMRPLNNVAAPLFALELAPPANDVLEVASPAYQQVVATAMATGVATFRDRPGVHQ